MGKGSSPPAPPDPVATAQAQAAASSEAARETARLNQFNQVSPFGTETFTGTLGEADRLRTIALDPADQQRLDQERQIALRLGGLAAGRIGQIDPGAADFGGLPAAPTIEQFDPEGGRTEQAVFSRLSNLITPDFDRTQRQLETQLDIQGIPEGSLARQRARDDFARNKANALENAALSAVTAGSSERNQLFGLASQARGSALNELLTERNLPFNELAAFVQGSPALNAPQFASPGGVGVGAPDIQGLIQQQFAAQQNQFNQQQANRQSTFGSLAGLGGALGAAFISNENLKTNKRSIDPSDILDKVIELKTERWTYKEGLGQPVGDHIGPYAAEFNQTFELGGGKEIIFVGDYMAVLLTAIQALAERVIELEAK